MKPEQLSLIEGDEVAPMPSKPIQNAFDLWNEIAKAAGWPEVTARTTSRQSTMRRALRDVGGLVGWKTLLEDAAASAFLTGKVPPTNGHRQFVLSYDWLVKPANLVKVMEGNYRDGERAPATTAPKATWREKQVDDAKAALKRVLGK